MAIEINSYFPEKVLTNEQLASEYTTSKGELYSPDYFYNKLGVKRRFTAAVDETVSDMAIKAVEGLKISAASPEMVFFSTSYPDGVNNAYELVKHFNYEADECMNIHAACSGFGLALETITAKKERFSGKSIMIATSEKYSPTLMDLSQDPSLSKALFSDGATALRFTEGEDMEILNAASYTFPKEASTCLRMPIDYRLIRHPAIVVDIPPSENGRFWMDGQGVYQAIRSTLPDFIFSVVKGAKLEPGQIRMVIPHQASKPMLGILSKKLPDFEIYQDLEDGNWSSASIPKALDRALNGGAIGRGDFVVIAGFGAGLFTSVAVVKLN